jgi:flagellar biosynthetic protein FlhB
MAVAEESDLEKTEPASARRLEQAREEGNVPQSRELMAFMVLAAGAGTFWVLGGWIANAAAGLVRSGLSFSRGAAFDTSVMRESALVLTVDAFRLAGPVFLAIIAAVIATPYIMGGPAMSSKAFQLDLTRMDPVKGLGRMFSWHSVAELVKAVLKALLVGVILYWIVRNEQDRLFSLITQPIEVGLASFSQLLFFSIVALVSGTAAHCRDRRAFPAMAIP